MSDRREGRQAPRAARGVLWVLVLSAAVLLAATALAQALVWVMG